MPLRRRTAWWWPPHSRSTNELPPLHTRRVSTGMECASARPDASNRHALRGKPPKTSFVTWLHLRDDRLGLLARRRCCGSSPSRRVTELSVADLTRTSCLARLPLEPRERWLGQCELRQHAQLRPSLQHHTLPCKPDLPKDSRRQHTIGEPAPDRALARDAGDSNRHKRRAKSELSDDRRAARRRLATRSSCRNVEPGDA